MPTTTFSYDEEMEELFKVLRKEFKAGTKAELLRKAIALLDEVRKLRGENKELGAFDPSTGKVTERIVMP